jgi:hypothetical protein
MNTPIVPQPPAWLKVAVLAHRIAGLVGIPFLLISIVIAVSLTHTKLLLALSEAIYPSLPIPQVALDEPVRPGSWDQTLRLAKLAAGSDARVIGARSDRIVSVSGFAQHSHDLEAAKSNPQTQYLIDTTDMRIVRVEGKATSIFSQAHGVHAYRFFGLEWASVAFFTTLALIVLLVTGALMGWHDRRVAKSYTRISQWHVRIGQAVALLTVAIAITTLDFEFNWFRGDRTSTHPIPAVALDEPIQPGSIDQARRLVGMAIGATPKSVFIQTTDRLKFSEDGDGIGGKSVWVNPQTMTIARITDWRNDSRTLSFIIHDGRWLGGMNAFNINDAVALGLLLLTISGLVIYYLRLKSRDA